MVENKIEYLIKRTEKSADGSIERTSSYAIESFDKFLTNFYGSQKGAKGKILDLIDRALIVDLDFILAFRNELTVSNRAKHFSDIEKLMASWEKVFMRLNIKSHEHITAALMKNGRVNLSLVARIKGTPWSDLHFLLRLIKSDLYSDNVLIDFNVSGKDDHFKLSCGFKIGK